MLQVLFWIPVSIGPHAKGIPIYGFGVMLFLALLVCMLIAGRRAAREGIDRERLYDLAFWVFISGILGARIVYMIQYGVPLANFYRIWEGGIVFYGSALGGWVGYALARFVWFRNRITFSTWKLADVVAPTVCVGLAIGRIGCLLNGCCYGHVCPESRMGITFPIMTAPARDLVVMKDALQTTAGFSMDEQNLNLARVGAVEPGSPAAAAGLRTGDTIIRVNDSPIDHFGHLQRALLDDWPRGETALRVTVRRPEGETVLPPFTPRTVRLHPAQVYETISMTLLFLMLSAFFPFRRHYGQVFVLLMVGYAIHRFCNETLRNDTDPVVANLTLSQVGSLGVLLAALLLELYLRRFGERVVPAGAGQQRPESAAQAIQAKVAPG